MTPNQSKDRKLAPRPWTHKFYDYWYDANGDCFYDCEHEGGFHSGNEAIWAFMCVNENEALKKDLDAALERVRELEAVMKEKL